MTADQDQIQSDLSDRRARLECRRNPGITGFRPSASSYQCLGFGASLGASGDLYVASHQFVCDQGCASQDAYRGVPGMMVPRKWDQVEFLRQAKCYAVTLFGDWDFMELYQGHSN